MASPDFNVLAVAYMQIFILRCSRISKSRTTEPRMQKHANVGVSRANSIQVTELPICIVHGY
jgi:hypothetical protein